MNLLIINSSVIIIHNARPKSSRAVGAPNQQGPEGLKGPLKAPKALNPHTFDKGRNRPDAPQVEG